MQLSLLLVLPLMDICIKQKCSAQERQEILREAQTDTRIGYDTEKELSEFSDSIVDEHFETLMDLEDEDTLNLEDPESDKMDKINEHIQNVLDTYDTTVERRETLEKRKEYSTGDIAGSVASNIEQFTKMQQEWVDASSERAAAYTQKEKEQREKEERQKELREKHKETVEETEN